MSKNRGRPEGQPQTVFFLPGISSDARDLSLALPFVFRAAPGQTVAASRKRRERGDGGAYRDRTDDLKLAKLPLSQLS